MQTHLNRILEVACMVYILILGKPIKLLWDKPMNLYSKKIVRIVFRSSIMINYESETCISNLEIL